MEDTEIRNYCFEEFSWNAFLIIALNEPGAYGSIVGHPHSQSNVIALKTLHIDCIFNSLQKKTGNSLGEVGNRSSRF